MSPGAGGPIVLGIDVGTESCRVGALDVTGRLLGMGRAPYPTSHPRPGWAEQDPQDWWSALRRATADCLAAAQVQPPDVVALAAAATTLTLIPCTETGQVVRPALLWMDVRAAAQTAVDVEAHPAAVRHGGGAANAEWLPTKAAWLAEHEPEVYAEARYLADATDWLTHRLTGRWTQNITSAAHRMYFDAVAGGYPEDLYQAIGAPQAWRKVPATVLDLGERAGELTGDAAAHLGLRAGIPVAQGSADAWAAQIGLGVLQPGPVALITGSSHVLSTQLDHPRSVPGLFGAFPHGVVPGQYTLEGGQSSTGSAVAWFVRRFAAAGEPLAAAYDRLNAASADLPPGAEGLVVNEYFQGNRTPYSDASARASIRGLSLHHGPEHLYRAIQESVCFGTEHVLDTMRGAGVRPTELVACGGATRSEHWIQMHADVTGLPVALTEVPDAVVLGSAILAATVAGLHGDVGAAAAAMVRRTRVLAPDPERHHAYRPFSGAYRETYPALRESTHRLDAHLQQT